MVPEVRRHELKYYLNGLEAAVLGRRLSALMAPDPNAGPDGSYSVRSLYFDDYFDTSLAENLAGLDNRVKYRLRIYDMDPTEVKLERKAKVDGLTGKRAAILDRCQAGRIMAGDLDWMATSGEALLMDFYLANRTRILSPKVVVDYRRRAFAADAGDTRITIDSSIKTSVAGLDMFDPGLAMADAFARGISILEVKFDAFLPEHIARSIQLGSRERQSASKFAVSRLYGKYSNI